MVFIEAIRDFGEAKSIRLLRTYTESGFGQRLEIALKSLSRDFPSMTYEDLLIQKSLVKERRFEIMQYRVGLELVKFGAKYPDFPSVEGPIIENYLLHPEESSGITQNQDESSENSRESEAERTEFEDKILVTLKNDQKNDEFSGRQVEVIRKSFTNLDERPARGI